MFALRHLVGYIKADRQNKKPLYVLSLMILFWSVYEGIVSYIFPIVITDRGISESMMGVIIGTSSVFGALFDFIACRTFKNTHFKRLFLIMFILSALLLLVMFKAHVVTMYLLATSIWGICYDLKNIGEFDFVGRFTKKEEHAADFGVLQVFQSVGYLLSPILIGILIAESLDWKPFAVAWIFLAIALVFLFILNRFTRKYVIKGESKMKKTRRTTWSETVILSRIGKILFPVLLLTLFLNFIDSFFWTVGPLFAESLSGPHQFAGFFMTAYTLPSLLVGWFVGSVTRRYGQKMTAFMSLLIGSTFLSLISFFDNPYLILADVFMASVFISVSWPSISGAYADYINETANYEKEIEGLEDFYTNIGYIIGPMLAGFSADYLGNSGAFTMLGFFGFCMALILIVITPKKISVLSSFGRTI